MANLGTVIRPSALALAVLLALPGVAAAHTGLGRAAPADGARLPAPPAQVLLEFTGPVLALEDLEVSGPGGEALVVEGRRGLDGRSIDARLRQGGVGTYTVRWAVQGADGHAASGDYRFAVLATADTTRRLRRAAAALIGAAVRLRAAGPR